MSVTLGQHPRNLDFRKITRLGSRTGAPRIPGFAYGTRMSC